MRVSFMGLMLLWHFSAAAQPVFLTEDRIGKKESDGYAQGYLIDDPKELDGIVYFSTPNFRLYQTDGTPGGTKVVVQFPAGALVYLKAVTKKYVYFTQWSGTVHELKRTDRFTGKQEALTNYGKPLTLDPAYSKPYVSTSKDLLAVRMFNLDLGITQLIAFPDNGSTDAKEVKVSIRNDNSALLNNLSVIAFLGQQIFIMVLRQKMSMAGRYSNTSYNLLLPAGRSMRSAMFMPFARKGTS